MLKEPFFIGVIGGVGPYAGLDFFRNILTNTRAAKDQDHLNAMLISCPALIPDRTGFLLGGQGAGENPALGIFESARRLYLAGATHAAVACNTAHAGRIFNPFCAMARESLPRLKVLNMLEICGASARKRFPQYSRAGLLATLGTHKAKVYQEYFKAEAGFTLLEPDDRGQERVHEAIYSEEFGVKAHPQEITDQAASRINQELERLVERGAQMIILGCTELPLALQGQRRSVPLIDPGLIAARELIQLAAPEKLLPL